MLSETCDKCGAKLEENQKFCPNCGVKRTINTCQSCGAELQDGYTFCPACGAPIASARTLESSQTPPQKKIAMRKLVFVGIIALVLLAVGIKLVASTVSRTGLGTFKGSEDLIVIGAIKTDDGRAAIAVQNKGEKTVREYEVAYIGYDASGNYVELGSDNIYDTSRVTSANILPNETHGFDVGHWLRDSDKVMYIEATVSSITFTDGSSWTASGLGSWAKDTTSNFSVEQYKQKIEGLKFDSDQAESNPYVEIVSTKKYSDRQFSEDHLEISVKNTAGKNISRLEFLVLEYDQNGYAVTVSPSDFVMMNCHIAEIVGTLAAGETRTAIYDWFFSDATQKYRSSIYKVEFSDGTVWTNPYTFQWLVYNRDLR